MSKRTIRWIIALMSVAMIGLISYQVYWIDNAIKVNDVQFRQNVHEALNNVVSQLEKSEIYYTAKQLQKVHWQQQLFYQDSDQDYPEYAQRKSQHNPNLERINKTDSNEWVPDLVFEDSVYFGRQKIKISYQLKDNYFTSGSENGLNGGSIPENRFEMNLQSMPGLDDELMNSIEKFAQKSHMITSVLDQMLSDQKHIGNRIDPDELEKMLNAEFRSMGINLDYEYAVVDKAKDQFLFANFTDQDRKNVLTSDFSVRLFPNDISGNPHFLSIYFPRQAGFLLKKIWVTLTSSFLLVALIIFSFAYAIFAILKQKKVSEIKNDFINNMTHELKTPISTVALACEALQDREIKKNTSFVNNYVKVIQDENKRLQRQVEKVLQMATLDKKEYKLKFEELDVHQIIDKAIEHINLQVKKRGGKIEKHLHADNNRIISDEVHLTNIIYNLLDNANKYSRENPEIDIYTEDHHQGLLIRISDKGIGMSKEVLNKIFERFYRVPTGNLHDVKGFGLGLAYVRTILMALGGQINVKSTPGSGSTFDIILPLKNEQN